MMNEFNEYVRDCFSATGDIVIKSMMGGYLVYFKGKLIGDICGDELFLKRTTTSDRLLANSELRYPYEESKTLMHVFDSFDDKALIQELLEGMYAELPEKKAKESQMRKTEAISQNTLSMMDESMKNFKAGKAGDPIDFSKQ